MEIQVIDLEDGNIFTWMGIEDVRGEEITNLVLDCWNSYARPGKVFSFTDLLRVVGESVRTPEELFVAGHLIGRLVEQDCTNCSAKKILTGILAGTVNIQAVSLSGQGGGAPFTEFLKERIKKDVN